LATLQTIPRYARKRKILQSA